jgi:hypothetical protein
MSRINELKKQYPELNVTIFDLLNGMDPTKTYKYLPLLCKIFSKRFDIDTPTNKKEIIMELKWSFKKKGVSFKDKSLSELYALHQLTDFYPTEDFETMKDFIEQMEKNNIVNKDITSYKDLTEIRGAVSLASINELSKELETQVIKEYEDDKWVIIRPLTFQSSAKYGASTRWCTTYQKEKQYFEKYWRRGILVYFINKKTGYKFAGFKSLNGDAELSFWNSSDHRIDYLDVEADEYLFPIVRKILNSTKTNKDLCSEELVNCVMKECHNNKLDDAILPRMELLYPEGEPTNTEVYTNIIRETIPLYENLTGPLTDIRMGVDTYED